jgi:transposase
MTNNITQTVPLQSVLTAGIDTAKAKLDVAVPDAGRTFVEANTPQGWADLARTLTDLGVGRVGIEASGGYERGVIEVLRAAGFEVRLLQPMQVKFFARMRLRRAKNDTLDAETIARAAELIEPRTIEPDPYLTGLADHLTYVEQIEEDIARLKTRREHQRDPRLVSLMRDDIRALKKRRVAELRRIVAALRARPDLAHRLDLVTSVPGIGIRTAVALVVRLPELGRLTREEVASLAGLAPFDDDSGNRSGARHIAGGRARVRKSLFCAALPATFRWNPALHDLYDRLRARGKPYHVAMIACARKLLTYANAVLQRGTPWVAGPAS